ncbi:MAG: amidohydrolase family protein [Gammaproteobacteria bacterium]|nr:amidohydrolase family protein [Gammaproteobacteria bacterium]
MSACGYIYCRARLPADAPACPACGFPVDRSRLKDPAFVASVPVPDLPQQLVDMHQILPQMDGVLEMQLQAMSHFSIRRALLQSVPDQVASIWGNRQLRELGASHGEQFLISQFADPRMPDAIGVLQKISAAGVRVIKLLPVTGYEPDDPAFDEFWGAMQDLGLVAMIHTGFISARHKEEEARAGVFLNSRFANPLYFDQPARKFPRLQFILCHTGGPTWYEAAAQMVSEHDNVWGDLSGFGVLALERLLRVGANPAWEKLFWGNDSAPVAYPFNLRLHLNALEAAGRKDLAAALLHDNGQAFIQQFLA